MGLEMYLEELNGERAKMFYGLFMAYSWASCTVIVYKMIQIVRALYWP